MTTSSEKIAGHPGGLVGVIKHRKDVGVLETPRVLALTNHKWFELVVAGHVARQKNCQPLFLLLTSTH